MEWQRVACVAGEWLAAWQRVAASQAAKLVESLNFPRAARVYLDA